MSKALEFANAAFKPISNATGLIWYNVFEPWPRLFADKGVEKGGNIVGIDRWDEDLIRECHVEKTVRMTLMALRRILDHGWLGR